MSQIQLHKMDLNLLATFEALIEEGSVAAAADRLALTPSAVSHALGRLRTQFGDPLLVRIGGKMQPTPQAMLLAEELRPVLRSLRRALEPAEPFDPTTSDRVFRIAIHSSPAFVARVTAAICAAAPNVMIEWVRITATAQNDLADGLIDLLHLGGERYLVDGIVARELEPLKFFSFARKDHPANRDWSVETASQYRYLSVAVENSSVSPVDKEHRLRNRPRNMAGKGHDFTLVGPVLSASDFIATMPGFTMEAMWKTYDLQVLEPVAAPKDFRQRFAWSGRNDTDPGTVWLRDTVIAAFIEHEANIICAMSDAAIPLKA